MTHVIHIGYDDWHGLYVDGELVQENHSIDFWQLDQATQGKPFTFSNKECNEKAWYAFIEDGGRLPYNFNDIPGEVYA